MTFAVFEKSGIEPLARRGEFDSQSRSSGFSSIEFAPRRYALRIKHARPV
jgi:hypothetical protein